MVQTINEATIPKGTSFCGLRHSSAAVETESNPMYVKKTMAPPVRTPWKPLGINGFQLEGWTCPEAQMIKIKIAVILTPTIKLLAPALSRIPTTRITVRIITTTKPGTLKYDPVKWSEEFSMGRESLSGSFSPKF